MATNVQRPLEWMRFDPVQFLHLIDDLSLEQVGAVTKLMLKLWQFGPMPEADVRRVCRSSFDLIRERMAEFDEGLSFEMVEQARAYGKNRQAQTVKAGKASAAKRNERSTKDEQTLNERSTGVLSMSVSNSISKSIDRKEKVVKVEIWPTFQNFWDAYERKGNRKTAEAEWSRTTQAEREAIMEHVPRYNASKPDKQFRKDGERYLKHRVWEDAIVNTKTNGNQSESQLLAETLALAAERSVRTDNHADPSKYLDGRRQ